jgi:nuclease S1
MQREKQLMKRWQTRLGRSVALAAVCLGGVLPGLAWGPEGHRVVAVIAQMNLTPQASAQVNALLGPFNSLAAVSSWADDTRVDFPETAPWHYIDIPLDSNKIDMPSECPEENCVIAQIAKFEAVLKNPHSSEADRRTALKFVVHFVGDLHQPLHAEDNHDKGGNMVQVMFFGQPSNLHSVWDSGILHHIKPYDNQLAQLLAGRITPAERKLWEKGTLEDWALESHRLARDIAYKDLPPGPVPDIGQAYVDATTPVVETQLEKAGIRLAYLLNQSLP